MTDTRDLAGEQRFQRAAFELEQQLLEPELVDLMDGDEQQLVVGFSAALLGRRRISSPR